MGHNVDETKGKIKQAAGDLTGDKDLVREGKVDEAAGKAKAFLEDVGDKVEHVVDENKDRLTKD